MERIYLDYAAATPVAPEVLKAMAPYFSKKFGNPGSLHSFGQEALKAIDESREKIAKTIGAPPAGGFREIIFTGSATEANNLVLRGVIKNVRCQMSGVRRPRLIVSAIEHESILETARDLEKEGVEIIYLPVSHEGLVDLEKLKNFLNEQTILVSIICANNEIGTIQNISEISEIIRDFRNKKINDQWSMIATAYPLFHTDAVQAFQFLDCDVNKLGVDLMTLSAHKIYGPKGVGCLYIKSSNPKSYILNPIITGGGQEFGLRAGTENVASIVGFSKAVELAEKNREKETKRIGELADYFWKKLKKIYSQAEINGNLRTSQVLRLPNILNIYFPNQRADDLLIKLDLAGIAVSSGAACSARAMKPSYVLKAIGLPEQKIKSSLRFSFGRFTTKKEIDEALKIIKKII
ncbi:MAG: cysteine desulfurase family protein [Patescibacteria group bacterium]